MDKEICTLSIGKGGLDDDYTFYESGKIKRFYDKNTFNLNVEDWIEGKDISDSAKAKLLEKCKAEHLEKIQQLLK